MIMENENIIGAYTEKELNKIKKNNSKNVWLIVYKLKNR